MSIVPGELGESMQRLLVLFLRWFLDEYRQERPVRYLRFGEEAGGEGAVVPVSEQRRQEEEGEAAT